MNIFVRIQRLEDFQFAIVKYFTVHLEEDGVKNEVNEFFDFLNRMEEIEEVQYDLLNLHEWLVEIGNNYGAIKNLRLYCLVLNEHVVFLFNGGIKTTNNAKDCPNVGPHIKRANRIAKKIDELLKQNELTWNFDHTDIKFDKNLEFEL